MLPSLSRYWAMAAPWRLMFPSPDCPINHCDVQNGDMLVPHVQSTIMATDKVGLKVLQRAKCFDCYSTWHEAKMKGEVAASSAMLKASYNLDSFLPPYQNVNWQDKRSWPCATTNQPNGHPDPGSAAGLLTNIVEVSSETVHSLKLCCNTAAILRNACCLVLCCNFAMQDVWQGLEILGMLNLSHACKLQIASWWCHACHCMKSNPSNACMASS